MKAKVRRVKVRHFRKNSRKTVSVSTICDEDMIVGFLKNLNYIEGLRRKFILTGNINTYLPHQ